MSRTDELRMAIKNLGVSQRRTAALLEVDQRTVRYWCSGKYEPPLSAIYALRYLRTQQVEL